MGVIYIVSVEEKAGKTTLCAGFGRLYLDAGKNVGYLKPHPAAADGTDDDVVFMKHLLRLDDVVNSPDVVTGRDVVLVEAMLGSKPADALSQTAYGAAREMKAGVVIVEPYAEDAPDYTEVYQGCGENLLGVIVNKAPAGRLAAVREAAETRFAANGLKLLGVIPENRTLLAVTVGELAERLHGTIISSEDRADELVENFMLGAMVVDSGLDYFGRMEKKAAIVRQDRPDMQLAALETKTSCLVLGGSSQPPLYNVKERARRDNTPVISTDTLVCDIAESIDDILLGNAFREEKKIPRLTELMKQNLDMATLV